MIEDWIASLDGSTVALVAILSVGIFVQSAAGFAAGLLIVPAMLWCGYGIPEAQTAVLISTIPQNAWGLWSFRDAIAPRQVAWPAVGRLALLPLGIWTLKQMESFSVVTLHQIVGGTVLLLAIATMVIQPRRRETLHPVWAWIAFPLSGFLQGLVGMGGPPMVFWVQAHAWDTRQTRVFLFAMYLISVVPAMLILWHYFGSRIVPTAIISMLAIPILLAFSWVGLKAGTALGAVRLRAVTMILLALMGVMGLAAPWLR